MECRCPQESEFGGLFCISPKKSLGMEFAGNMSVKYKLAVEDDSGTVFATFVMAMALFLFSVFMGRKATSSSRYPLKTWYPDHLD